MNGQSVVFSSTGSRHSKSSGFVLNVPLVAILIFSQLSWVTKATAQPVQPIVDPSGNVYWDNLADPWLVQCYVPAGTADEPGYLHLFRSTFGASDYVRLRAVALNTGS
jgi:hypothetical protein